MFIKVIILLMFTFSDSKAIILDDLIERGILRETLSHKKIGYYPGSFDPLHLGHEQLAMRPIEMAICDYVLIYPNWGGDSYKKRADINFRHEMVFFAFKDNPNVIVTRLSPQEMQRALTQDKEIQEDRGDVFVESKFEGAIFIGIVGSDTALAFSKPEAEKARSLFMTGLKIPEKHYNHTLGGLMALPTDLFIVSIRAGETVSELNNKIGDRQIIAVIENENEDEQSLSSTKIKQNIKEGKSIDSLTGFHTSKIIKENGLYLEDERK